MVTSTQRMYFKLQF